MSGYRVTFGRLYYNGKYYNHMLLCTKKKVTSPFDGRYQCEFKALEPNCIGVLPESGGAVNHFGTEKPDTDGDKYLPVLALQHGFSEMNSDITYDDDDGDWDYVGHGRKVFNRNVPYWVFTFTQGGTSFKVRGDGIFRFNDGTIVRINTKVVNEGASLRRTVVQCPAGATEAIYVGTFSNIGTLRGARIQLSKESQSFDVPFIDFSGCAIKSIHAVNPVRYNVYWERTYYMSCSDHTPTADEILNGQAPGLPVQDVVFPKVSGGYHKTVWNLLKRKAYVVSPDGKRKRNDMLDLYPRRRRFTPLPTFYQAFANSGIESIDDVIDLITAARDAAYQYEKSLANYKTSEFYYSSTYIMSAVEMFYGCENLKSATIAGTFGDRYVALHALDYGYMFAECSALETVSDDFWSNLIYHDTHFVRGDWVKEGKFWTMPPKLFIQVRGMFKNCTALRDASDHVTRTVDGVKKEVKIWDVIEPKYRYAWPDQPDVPGYIITSNGCFEGCTGLADYADIPDWWKQPYGTECFSKTLYPGKETTT